ncbi:hypothetical protein [Virgisporangium aurantiacum]|uniref:hypothetical protein n=1 Tax=Virgisporangium aurantiacum TaxID=175570 RepID=UPI001EF231A3|nr:hypothetical protein [Virgisporangium aurantiacum]
MAGIDDLLPRARTPVDYLNVVADPRLDQAGLRALAASPYPFVRHAVAGCPRADSATLAAVVTDDLDRWTRNSVLAAIAGHPNADRPALLTILSRPTRREGWPVASAARSVAVQQLCLGRPEASGHHASGTVVCSLRVSGVVGVDLTADEGDT